jgi:hypothetical protein
MLLSVEGLGSTLGLNLKAGQGGSVMVRWRQRRAGG